MVKNLWGDLSSLAEVRSPKMILQEQASLLTDATKGVLVGVVALYARSPDFHYTLDIIVPALNNYKYQIFEVFHPLAIYPIRLSCERPRVDEELGSEEDFEKAVERVLSSNEVRDVLSMLKSQVAI